MESWIIFIWNWVNVFIHDVTNKELYDKILPTSVDVVTLIFMLSAVSRDSHILPRDYAVEDFAQVPSIYYWTCHGCENCSYCFSGDFLSNLFAEAGFEAVDMNVYCNLQTSRKSLPEFEISKV
ncbi:hypothetical protein OROMI_004467 [Orobanche minor]